MSIKPIHPSSLDGIKRLAKSIKYKQRVQHIRALDLAAQSAGFQNFRHARNVLTGTHPPLPQQQADRLFLTAYWRDKSSGANGRETLPIWLETLWSDLIPPQQLNNERALGRFRPEGPDHLIKRDLDASQPEAREAICAAARALQFMDATKLRPATSRSSAFPNGDRTNALPGRDHYSVWYDRGSKRYVLADEPYEGSALSHAAERAAWATLHGFTIAKPSWPGMYNPSGGSRLYLVSDAERGVSLEPLVAALDGLPEPIVEENWQGESAPATPRFVSPGALAQAAKRSAIPAT